MLVRITDITYRPLIKKNLIKDINATLGILLVHKVLNMTIKSLVK